jgi:hypothetical protein
VTGPSLRALPVPRETTTAWIWLRGVDREGGELVLEVGWDEDAEADVFAGGIVFLEHLAEGVDAGEGLLFGEGDSEVEFGADGFEARAQFREQFIESFAGAG